MSLPSQYGAARCHDFPNLPNCRLTSKANAAMVF